MIPPIGRRTDTRGLFALDAAGTLGVTTGPGYVGRTLDDQPWRCTHPTTTAGTVGAWLASGEPLDRWLARHGIKVSLPRNAAVQARKIALQCPSGSSG